MPIENYNKDPRSILYTGPILKTGMQQQFTVMDVGASGGLDPVLNPILPYTTVIGFEPNAKECKRLEALYAEHPSHADIKLYPTALSGKTGSQKIYISITSPLCDGLLPLNENFWKRYPNFSEVRTVDEMSIETVTLDEFVTSNQIPNIDFLKIDVEGAEFQILEAAENTLKNQKVLGLITEYIWEPDVKKGQAGFCDIDRFLRDQGLFLFDLQCWRFPRNPLPVGHIHVSQDSTSHVTYKESYRYQRYGQIITGNALYFRDPIKSAQLKTNQLEWTEEMVLKFITLLDLYNYQDYAIELVDYFRDIFRNAKPDVLIDSLTPRLGDKIVPYNEYFELSCELYKQGTPKHINPVIPRPRYSKS